MAVDRLCSPPGGGIRCPKPPSLFAFSPVTPAIATLFGAPAFGAAPLCSGRFCFAFARRRHATTLMLLAPLMLVSSFYAMFYRHSSPDACSRMQLLVYVLMRSLLVLGGCLAACVLQALLRALRLARHRKSLAAAKEQLDGTTSLRRSASGAHVPLARSSYSGSSSSDDGDHSTPAAVPDDYPPPQTQGLFAPAFLGRLPGLAHLGPECWLLNLADRIALDPNAVLIGLCCPIILCYAAAASWSKTGTVTLSYEDLILLVAVCVALGRTSTQMEANSQLRDTQARLARTADVLADVFPIHVVDRLLEGDCGSPEPHALVGSSPAAAMHQTPAAAGEAPGHVRRSAFAAAAQVAAAPDRTDAAAAPWHGGGSAAARLSLAHKSASASGLQVPHIAADTCDPDDAPFAPSPSPSPADVNDLLPRRASLCCSSALTSALSACCRRRSPWGDSAPLPLLLPARTSSEPMPSLQLPLSSPASLRNSSSGRSPAPLSARPSRLLPDVCDDVAQSHGSVTVLFSDIVGFSSFSHHVAPEKVMHTLNDLFSRLDAILLHELPSLYKVETIGDAYVVAANLSNADPEHAATAVRFALRAQEECAKVMRPDLDDGTPLQMRIGLHSGPVTSGVAGLVRRRFCLFGDTMCLGARTETSCPPGSVQITASTYSLAAPYLAGEVDLAERGLIHVKGAEEPLLMYIAALPKEEAERPGSPPPLLCQWLPLS